MAGSDGVEALNGSVMSNQWSVGNGQGVRFMEGTSVRRLDSGGYLGQAALGRTKGPSTILSARVPANFVKQMF